MWHEQSLAQRGSLLYVAHQVLHVLRDGFGVEQSRVHSSFAALEDHVCFLDSGCGQINHRVERKKKQKTERFVSFCCKAQRQKVKKPIKTTKPKVKERRTVSYPYPASRS